MALRSIQEYQTNFLTGARLEELASLLDNNKEHTDETMQCFQLAKMQQDAHEYLVQLGHALGGAQDRDGRG